MAEKEKVVLAYSGGLDTSVIVKWLQIEKNLDVIAICGNVGQDEKDLSWIKQKALDMGAIASEAIDGHRHARRVRREDPLQGHLGQRQVRGRLPAALRAQPSAYLQAPRRHRAPVRRQVHREIIAPVREWDLTTRDSEMEWAEANGVPVPTTKKKPYSIDDNLWGRAIECGVLEDTWNKPPADIWTMTNNLEDCPAEPEEVVISFEEGIPTAINGEKMDLLSLIIKANEIAGRNGYGRIDMIEDRVVGIKSRECYECPAALLLIQAHQTLEQLCLDAETLKQKAKMDVEWASTVYRGLWFSQNRNAIDAYNAYTQKYVTGDVRIILCKGGLFVDGVRSAYSLYDYNLATYDEGDSFDHSAAEGFIVLHGLQSKTWSKVQGPGSGLQPVH